MPPPDRAVRPLYWWRRLPATDFGPAHIAVIKKAISGIGLVGEPHWPAAADGDPAAAIGVALRAIERHRTPTPGIDLVMSALLRCAIEGSAAASFVLANALSGFAAGDPACAAVAASWRSNAAAPRARRAKKTRSA